MTRIAEAYLSCFVGGFAVLACGSGQGATTDPSSGSDAGTTPSSVGGNSGSSSNAAGGSAAVGGGPVSDAGGAVATATGGMGSEEAGAAGDGAVPAWCATHSSDCRAALDHCSAYAACQADATCSATLDAFSECLCEVERASGTGTFIDCQSKLGATGSLSASAGACWQDASYGASSICGLIVRPGCNQLQLRDPMVQELKNPLQPPSYTGGPISDGIYTLSRHTQYLAGGIGPVEAGGEWVTLEIACKTWQLVTAQEQQGGVRSTETVSVSGTTVTPTQTCPGGQALAPFSYSATDTTLTLNDGTEFVFTKLAR